MLALSAFVVPVFALRLGRLKASFGFEAFWFLLKNRGRMSHGRGFVPWYRYNDRLSRNGFPGPKCSAEGWNPRYRDEPPLVPSLLYMVLAIVPDCPTLIALSLGVGSAGLAGLRQSSRSVYLVLYHDRVWWMSWTWLCSCLECKMSWRDAGWMCPLTMKEVFEAHQE